MPLIHALGTTVRVDLGEEIEPEDFAQAWSRCLVSDGEEMTGVTPDNTSDDETPTVRAHGSMTALTQSVTRALIERRAGELLMLHAGAVCHPQTGRSIAYIAPGGTGKTTLTRLLGQDYGYLTDETVGIEPGSWRIRPYEKPLSLRTPDGGHPKSEHGPDGLGLVTAHPSPRLSSLVLLRRDPGVPGPTWTRLGLFDAIVALAPETSSLSRLDRPLHLLADLYAAVAGCWLVGYAEADEVVPGIVERLGEP